MLTKVTLIEKDKDLKPEMSAKVTFLEPQKPAAAATAVPQKPDILVPRLGGRSRATAARRCSRSSRARPPARAR